MSRHDYSGIADGWFKMPMDALPHIIASTPRPLPEAVAIMDLSCERTRAEASGDRMPGHRVLAKRWGWTTYRVRQLLAEPWKWTPPDGWDQ